MTIEKSFFCQFISPPLPPPKKHFYSEQYLDTPPSKCIYPLSHGVMIQQGLDSVPWLCGLCDKKQHRKGSLFTFFFDVTDAPETKNKKNARICARICWRGTYMYDRTAEGTRFTIEREEAHAAVYVLAALCGRMEVLALRERSPCVRPTPQ